MTPRLFARDTDWALYQGHVLDVLRCLDDESVHAVITSPPYWGLRDYAVPPVVWGGSPECSHHWSEPTGYVGHRGERGQVPKTKWPSNRSYPQHTGTAQATCERCGAWRGQLGQEPTPGLFVEHLVEVFREVRRVLRRDGTLWVVLGDTYATSSRAPDRLKPKDLVGVPWAVALALRDDGWWLRADVIYAKANSMPESVQDRPTRSHEYVFLLARSERYYYDAHAIAEPALARNLHDYTGAPYRAPGQPPQTGNRPREGGATPLEAPTRNRRSVWWIVTEPFPDAHYAVFPRALVEPMVLAATSPMTCPRCGAPWRRVTAKGTPVLNAWSPKGAAQFDRDRNGYAPATAGSTLKHVVPVETVGWQPTCDCPGNDGSGKAVVLDPFAGSGTTLQVAVELGRAAIGIELSEDYCRMVTRRMASVQRPLFALAEV